MGDSELNKNKGINNINKVKCKHTVNLNNLIQIPTKNSSPKPLISKCSKAGYIYERYLCVDKERFETAGFTEEKNLDVLASLNHG